MEVAKNAVTWDFVGFEHRMNVCESEILPAKAESQSFIKHKHGTLKISILIDICLVKSYLPKRDLIPWDTISRL